ncbi:hypothetical protein D9M68_668770 [compost metagenome]
MTSVAQFRRRACSDSCSATSAPVSTAVAAPSSSASLSTARMRSRCAASRRCSRGVSTYAACQRTLSCPASRAAVRTVCAAPSCGPTQARIAPEVFQACSAAPPCPLPPGPDCSTRQPRTSSSTCSAVRRRAISRSAIRLPLRKKFCAARSACCGRYTLPAASRAVSSSGVTSTSTTSSASSSTVSGTVSCTRTPVMAPTVPLRLSRCCTLSADHTSMPAASSSCTSCQRLAWREPGALVWASSSTSSTAGLRARAASRSNSASVRPR